MAAGEAVEVLAEVARVVEIQQTVDRMVLTRVLQESIRHWTTDPETRETTAPAVKGTTTKGTTAKVKITTKETMGKARTMVRSIKPTDKTMDLPR